MERTSGNKSEYLLQKQGGTVAGLLEKIAEKFKSQFESAEMFSEHSEQELSAEMNQRQTEMAEWVKLAWQEFEGLKSKEISGHEQSHVADNLNSVFRIIKEFGDLQEFEKLEMVLAVIAHDLGRYNEEVLNELNPKDIEFLAPSLIGRNFLKRTGASLPKNLQSRIIYDIGTGSKRTTGYRTADIVHQADREQLIGSATIPRGLGFDVGLGKRALQIPEQEDLKFQLPTPDSDGDRYWLLQYEFYMRNLYPPVSPEGEKKWIDIKKENSVILLLAAAGDDNLQSQIFYPELNGLTSEDSRHWSKKPLPKGVLEEAQAEAKNFTESLDFKNYQIGKESELALKIMEAEGVIIPPELPQFLTEQLNKMNDQQRKNFWTVLKFTQAKRLGKLESSVEDLKKAQSPVEEALAEIITKDFTQRINKYKSLN